MLLCAISSYAGLTWCGCGERGGPGGYPGRTDRRQGHALRAPDSELTTSVPVPVNEGCLPTGLAARRL